MKVLSRALLATAAIAGLASTAMAGDQGGVNLTPAQRAQFGNTQAADLPYVKAAPIPVRVYSWTGFYGGVYGGASTANSGNFGIDPSTPNTGGVGFGPVGPGGSPVFSGAYNGLASGGIGLIHALARRLGLIDALDRRLELLKVHLPYHESDHVLALAYLPLCGGTCLQDLELLRHDEVLLDALGARRIPDPTTAGDFCRRFTPQSIQTLLDVINDTRLKVWAKQPPAFFEQARLDMDGFLIETTGQCKKGMDIAYDGTWGYHACVLTLANTGEVLSIVNRPGNRPSHEGAATLVDQATAVCFRGGFRRVCCCPNCF